MMMHLMRTTSMLVVAPTMVMVVAVSACYRCNRRRCCRHLTLGRILNSDRVVFVVTGSILDASVVVVSHRDEGCSRRWRPGGATFTYLGTLSASNMQPIT